MDKTHARAEAFTELVGLELKGRIVSQGFTAQRVAVSIERTPATFNRWLNGRRELPLSVLCEACEVIGVDPAVVVEGAYARLRSIDSAPTSREVDLLVADEEVAIDVKPAAQRPRPGSDR